MRVERLKDGAMCADSWGVGCLRMGRWMMRFGVMKMREILGNLRATKGMKTLRKPGSCGGVRVLRTPRGRPAHLDGTDVGDAEDSGAEVAQQEMSSCVRAPGVGANLRL